MKSFLIKIGKAGKILRKEGLIGGGKRTVLSGMQFLKMLKKPQAGDVLFIAGGAMGDSTLYRVHHQMEELSTRGFKCAAVAQDNPWLVGSAKNFKIFIFHRVLFTEKIKKLIDEIKKEKKEIIFETDDLFFDWQHLSQADSYKNMNKLERMLYENGLGGEILKDLYVKTCVTATAYLADKLKEHGKQVFVSKNKLSDKDLAIINHIQDTRCKMQDTKIRIGYFSGTLSHNKDFATITEALTRIMEKYPAVELFLSGSLDIESELNKFKNRIQQFPRVSREKYFENISQTDINLAPLELNNPFCEAKSELKFFEAGILGVPTVAVKNRTFSEAMEDGVDGFLADNVDEWVEKLEKLIIDENLRREMGQKAREKSLQNYTNKNSHNNEYYDYLKNKL